MLRRHATRAPFQRRSLAVSGRTLGWLAFTCLFTLVTGSNARAQDPVYNVLRMRWFAHLTGDGHGIQQDPDVASAVLTLTKAAQSDWSGLQAEQTSNSGCFAVTGSAAAKTAQCYGELRTMALAYQAMGGTLYHNRRLAKSIVDDLDSLYANNYNERLSEKGNWWFWEFGIPLSLEDTVVLMYDSLTTQQIDNYMRAIDHFLPSPQTSTGGGLGANGAWSAQVCTLKSILLNNSDGKLSDCRNKFNELLQYVDKNDGYYRDGSYVGHTYFAYTGGYGMDFLASLGAAFVLYAEPSPFPLNPERMQIVSAWVDRSYATLLYNGLLPYYVVGREFGRPYSTDYSRGVMVALACLNLANGLSGSPSMAMKRFAKTVLSDLQAYPIPAGRSLYDGLTVGDIRQINAVITDDSVELLDKVSRSTVFSRMNKVEHNTPSFGFGISMFSTDMQNYEDAGENRHGWHQSDGMTYLFNSDRDQYDNGYWPTVDSNRLAGTTVNEDDAIPSNLFNGSPFAGGATLDGRYSAVGFVLHPAGDTLTAQKAYFLFDKEVVCLGSGIADTHGTAVETIVENRKLDTAGTAGQSPQLTIDGEPYRQLPSNRASELRKVHWIHLRGSVAGSDIGYWFPNPVTADLKIDERSGFWSDLHGPPHPRRYMAAATSSVAIEDGSPRKAQPSSRETDASLPPVSNRYFTMWIPHGINPVAARYEYVLLPSYSLASVAAFSQHSEIKVLENTEYASAVRNNLLHMTSVIFWKDGTHESVSDPKGKPYIVSDHRSAVIVRESGSTISAAVADPTREYTGTVNLTIAAKGRSVISHDPAITVMQISPTIHLRVDFGNDEGPKGRSLGVVIER